MTKIFAKAFTLIELLIVIVIIGILATTLIPRIKGMQDKARYTSALHNIAQFKAVIYLAQSTTQKNLALITSPNLNTIDTNSEFPVLCLSQNLQTLPNNHICRTKWVAILRSVEVAAGIGVGSLGYMETDPWGAPYVFANGEGYGGNNCDFAFYNWIHSAGSDGLYNISSYNGSAYNTGSTDDINETYRSIFCSDAY